MVLYDRGTRPLPGRDNCHRVSDRPRHAETLPALRRITIQEYRADLCIAYLEKYASEPLRNEDIMFGKKKKNAIAYGIIGLGRFGEALATELARSGAELLVMDREEEQVREMRELTENALVVNTLDKKTLTETGIQNCDIAVVCIGEHMESSILTTLNLVSLGIPTVIAKATSPEHGEILKRLGAQVVYPERDMAIRLATRLSNSRVLDFIQLSEKLNITKLSVPDALVQKSVVELNLRARFGLNIIAIEHNGQVIEHVDPNYRFCPGDILILSGSKESLSRFDRWIDKQE